MRSAWMIPVCGTAVLGACGEVKGEEPDAAIREPDAAIDATPAAEPCNGVDDDRDNAVDEGWAGSFQQGFAKALPAWDVARYSEGVANNFARDRAGFTTVTDGTLLLDDAELSMSRKAGRTDVSWIDDLDLDRGNQLSHAVGIGKADFAMTVEYTVKSLNTEAMLAGVALTDDKHFIEVLAAAVDPTVRAENPGASMRVWVRQHDPSTGRPVIASAETAHASYRVQVERTGDQVTVEQRTAPGDGPVDPGAPAMSQTVGLNRAIAHVALVGVHLNTAPFGSVAIRRLAVCWKAPPP